MSRPHPATPLFHWSPTTNRKQILRYGLLPDRRSLTNIWRAPHICFAESPSWAWALSGYFHPEILEWDLWQTHFGDLTNTRIIKSYDNHRWHEIRTTDRVYKRNLFYVATRSV